MFHTKLKDCHEMGTDGKSHHSYRPLAPQIQSNNDRKRRLSSLFLPPFKKLRSLDPNLTRLEVEHDTNSNLLIESLTEAKIDENARAAVEPHYETILLTPKHTVEFSFEDSLASDGIPSATRPSISPLNASPGSNVPFLHPELPGQCGPSAPLRRANLIKRFFQSGFLTDKVKAPVMQLSKSLFSFSSLKVLTISEQEIDCMLDADEHEFNKAREVSLIGPPVIPFMKRQQLQKRRGVHLLLPDLFSADDDIIGAVLYIQKQEEEATGPRPTPSDEENLQPNDEVLPLRMAKLDLEGSARGDTKARDR